MDRLEVPGNFAHAAEGGRPPRRGADPGSTSGPVPDGGWLLSMEQMDHVYADDDVGGGVILGEHQDALEEQGKLFPPDPTSRYECTVGAAIACNASGARSFRYGPTRSWVEAVEVVLPSGEVCWADRDTPIPADWPQMVWEEPEVKTAAGFYPADNLLDLMIGQEGTLGIITRARLKLIPVPAAVLGLVCFFPDLTSCIAFVECARSGAARRGAPASPGARSSPASGT